MTTTIEVGDTIVSSHAFGGSTWVVHRVSKKFAFVRLNDVAEGKFRRELGFSGPQPYPAVRWQMTRYKLIKKEAS